MYQKKALKKLDNSLPVWVDAVMRGNNPWVLGVNIICGGGSQILSDAVKEWICRDLQVANQSERLNLLCLQKTSKLRCKCLFTFPAWCAADPVLAGCCQYCKN